MFDRRSLREMIRAFRFMAAGETLPLQLAHDGGIFEFQAFRFDSDYRQKLMQGRRSFSFFRNQFHQLVGT